MENELKSTKYPQNYTTADILKFFCAVLVVGIHTQPFGNRLYGVGYTFTSLCRIAVPFFFVFSSFLYFKKKSSLRRYLKRMFMLEFAWTFLECPFIFKTYFFSGDSLMVSCLKLFRGMLFGETYLGSWFIHASWEGMVLVYVLSRSPKSIQITISGVLFFFAMLDSSYQFLVVEAGMGKMWESINEIIYPSESFMVAIPYFFIGKYMANENFKLKHMITVLLSYALVILIGEAWMCRFCSIPVFNEINNPRFEVFLTLPVIVFLLVTFSLNKHTALRTETSKYLRNMSILIYLSHRILMIGLYKLGFEPEGFIFFFVTVLVSAVFSCLIIKLSSCIGILKRLY